MEELEEEVIIVWIAITLAPQGLDFVVDPFDPAGRDVEGGMGDNALKMLVQNTAENDSFRRLWWRGETVGSHCSAIVPAVRTTW